MHKSKSLYVWLVLAVMLITLDQISKLYVEYHFDFAERQNILPFFDLILVYNTGAAFSIAADAQGWQRGFFIGLALAASAFIVYLLKKNTTKTLFCFGITLIMAGAVGNVIDRIVHGHVIDFLLFYWENWNFYFPAFNLADCWITVGAALVIIDDFFFSREKKPV